MTRLIKFVAAILISLYLILAVLSFGFRGRPHLRAPERFVVAVTAPMQRLVNAGVDGIGNVVRHYIALTGTAKENERLMTELDRTKSQQTRMAELEGENRRLRDLLGLAKERQLDLLGAEVQARGFSPYEQTVRISRGERDGLASGMAVLHPRGVVGQVIEVFPGRSDVLLLTDQTSALDVFAQRSRTRGIARGSRYNEIRLEYVPKTEDLQVGDEVVTSGLDGVFPKGIPVGVVTSVGKGGTQLFLSASVRPHVEVAHLEEVAVVTGPRPGGSP